MRHKDSYDWPWHPDLQAVFDALGLTWKVLSPGDSIDPDDLGSSPGDCYYTGRTFVFEYLCPPEWVVHELAHWLVCRAQRPKLLRRKNYGYERDDVDDDEVEVAALTVGLERHFNLGDYLETADALCLYKGREGIGDNLTMFPYRHLDADDPVVIEMARRVDELSAKYIGTLPEIA